eukprot:TRINITY_DN924_c0_g1_i8.p1 TRINITY_DN924_c0_g1~~TRINITY_DN924_c0_g1_i8.p1  ORF type:complete len:821 (-),score=308.30 TRINITY_DN924_c0_g1_i8:120-2582(-)
MSKSEVILSAISKVTKNNEELKYISKIREEPEFKFLCLGRENIILFNKDFMQTNTISYASIECVDISNSDKGIVLKIKGAPDYTFRTPDEEGLIEILQCCWTTDYMYKNAEYANFPLKTRKVVQKQLIDKRVAAAKAIIKTDATNIVIGDFLSYGFLMNADFKPVKGKPGKFENKENGAIFTIEVSDELNVQLINLMGIRQELQNFAECYAKGLITNEDYWIAWSRSYQKKWNINEDISSWESWEVYFRTNTHDYIVIIMRRKFEPPLLDLFNDIACWYKGNIILDQKLEDNPHLLEARIMCDTLHSKNKCDEFYKEIIQLKAQALLLSEEEMLYINSVHEGAAAAHVALASKAVKILRSYRKSKSSSRESRRKSADVMSVVKDMNKKTKLPEDMNYIWECKVAHFLASYLDTEEDVSVLSLSDAIVNLEITSDDATSIENLLQYLLHIRLRGMPYDNSQPFSTLLMQLTSVLLQKGSAYQYLYNARVMRILIESGYISKVLKLEQLTAYKKFLDGILINTEDNRMKLSALRHIREMFKEEFMEKKKTDEQSIINYSQWLKPVAGTLKSNWSLLVQAALNALTQMLNADQIVKEQLLSYPNILEVFMETCKTVKDDDTLEFTLLPLYILVDDKAFSEILVRKYELVNFIFAVLKPPGIPGIEHSADIKIRAIYVLGKACDNYHEAIRKIEELGGIADIINMIAVKEEDDSLPSADLIKAVTSFIYLLAKNSTVIKTQNSLQYLTTALELLKLNKRIEFLLPESLTRIGKTMLQFVRNSAENCKLLGENYDTLEMYKKGLKSVVQVYLNLYNYVLESVDVS